MGLRETQASKLRAESCKVGMLADMLGDNLKTYIAGSGRAGEDYDKNHNASKTAILNQITTLRNELLVLAETIKA